MSRGQQQSVINTASGVQKNDNTLANTSFNSAQQDIGEYSDALGGFKAANPYVQGGSVQTAQNQQIADTAAGQAERAGAAVQGAAVRTGQNAGGAIAATKDMEMANERALAGEEAGAAERRAAAGTGYGEAVLAGKEKIPGMEDQIAAQEGQLAQGALNTQESASQTPSFFDTLGSSFASQLGKTLGGGTFSMSKQF